MSGQTKSAAGSTRPTLRAPLLFALIFSVLFVLHAPLLRLPYFWDEAGYYVPAARDLLLTGDLIPHSTVSNAHPPLVMAWLAAWWKLSGYTPAVTRTAMLLVAAFALLGLFRLARRVANTQVAVATIVCTALYPVFFSQSSMAHLDLTAAAFTFWGLDFYFIWREPKAPDICPPLANVGGLSSAHFSSREATPAGSPGRSEAEPWVSGEKGMSRGSDATIKHARSAGALTVLFFSLAALAKETAIIAPLALFAWELISSLILRRIANGRRQIADTASPSSETPGDAGSRRGMASAVPNPPPLRLRALAPAVRTSFLLLFPLAPLALWFVYHYHRTGYLFGNPFFFQYNVTATLHPLRILVALGMRLWQLLGYMNMFVLTLATAMALTFPPRDDRRAIAAPQQLALAAVVVAYAIVLAVIGGAVLARYLLPATPLVILIFVSTLRRRLPWWPAVIVVIGAGFVAGLLFNPPWRFAPEDNLAYRDYVLLHKGADTFVATKYPQKIVLTAWPASDELTRPWLRYVDSGVRVLRLENFTLAQVMAARLRRDDYDIVLAFSTKYEPRGLNLTHLLPFWERLQTRFFDYHRDLPPDAIARLLAARIVYQRTRGGQWIAVLDLEHAQNASRQSPVASRQ